MIDSETFTCPPDGGPLKRRLLGHIVPGIIIAYAVLFGLIGGHLHLPSRRSTVEFTGYAARWLGLSYLSTASFMHCHFGWGLSETSWSCSQKGKWISASAFLITIIIAFHCHSKLA